MIRLRLAITAALMVAASSVWAHEVPDHVRIAVFLKPENNRLLVLVRMPANALIDFLLPTLPEGNWLDLANADTLATAGAKVWIADLLPLTEAGRALPRPELLAIRLSRLNDPSFSTFDNALARITGARLPADTLVTQDQVTVDALLQTPIASPVSNFSFEPRFARLGVLVDTTVTFLPAGGGIRPFQYQGDADPFELDPGRRHAISRFLAAGFTHFFSESDYLLLALCIVLVFRRVRALTPFAAALAGAESVVLLAAVALLPPVPWIRGLCSVVIAAATVYMGIEAVVAGEGKRVRLAVAAGPILGAGFWIGLQPVLQFSGTHRLAAALGFNAGVLIAELITLALVAVAVQVSLRLSRAPRAVTIIAAAVAIHISWQRMLERADALALTPVNLPAFNSPSLMLLGGAAIGLLAGSAYYLARRNRTNWPVAVGR